MHIETPEGRPRRALICLSPPGNVAREIALYRRSLFADLGEGSALAFPEVAVLASCLYRSPPRPRRAARVFEGLWRGLGGAFVAQGILRSGELEYLRLAGPLKELSRRAEDALGELGLEPDPAPILEAGLGFFLLRRGDGEELHQAPRASFLDCSVALLAYAPGDEPFSALRWRLLAEARRRTGPA